jgi:hypothetical protein
MILYNDWDILELAIQSARRIADELVVVDGAYSWMAPLLQEYEQDPARSNAETCAILARHTDFVRYISGTWENESHKRIVAYNACRGDIVHLIDADEIHDWAPDAFNAFVRATTLIAEMTSPLLMPGGLLGRVGTRPQIGRKPTTFKRSDISAEQHLSYLWLVLPKSEQDMLPPREKGVFWHPSLGTNYHYSMLRTTKSAISRAMFYVFIKYLSPDAEDDPLNTIGRALRGAISPTELRNVMEGHHLTISFPLNQDLVFEPANLPGPIDGISAQIEAAMQSSLIAHRDLRSPRKVLAEMPTCFDITDMRRSGQTLDCSVTFSSTPKTMVVQLVDRMRSSNSYRRTTVARIKDCDHCAFQLPDDVLPDDVVRSMLSIMVELAPDQLVTEITQMKIAP